MNRTSTLARLQRIDRQIAESARRMQQIEQELTGDAELAAAQIRLMEGDRTLTEKRAQLREKELAARSLDAKIKELEQHLYSGQVTNPKELDGYARDQEMHKRMRRDLDEPMLVLMEAIESAQITIEQTKETAARLGAERGSRVAELSRELEEVRKELAELDADRVELRGLLAAQTLALYDDLVKIKAGQALTQLKQGSCGTCGVTVPSGLIARAKQGDETVVCPNCGRIFAA